MIRKTKSVCPVCLKTLDAELELVENDDILLVKTCPEHGLFSSVVWRGKPSYFDWTRKQIEHDEKNLLRPLQLSTKTCPQNCGLCPEHKQSSCTVLLELTDLCNLSCQICFANSQKYPAQVAPSPIKPLVETSSPYKTSLSHNDSQSQNCSQAAFEPLESMYGKIDWIHKTAGQVILQLSGGEPTLYPHLLEVVKYASHLFPAVQLNTNGILLASDKSLAKKLKDAGLSWVFLQFDAPNDDVYLVLRGQKLMHVKQKALENCRKAGLSVVLVSVLVHGVNDHKIGDLLDFALENYPTVRGIHFQPMTKSGRNLKQEEPHITLPEVISLVAEQSQGQIKIEHAHAPDCEHTLCAFHARYFVDETLKLQYIHDERQKENPYKKHADYMQTVNHTQLKRQNMHNNQDPKSLANTEQMTHINLNTVQNIAQKNTLEILQNAPKRSIESVIRAWKGDFTEVPQKDTFSKDEKKDNASQNATQQMDAFDIFLEKAKKHIFSITCMAFQDVHTLDLQRLQQCCVHIYAQKNAEHVLVPFCAYNLTSLSGEALHREKKSKNS